MVETYKSSVIIGIGINLFHNKLLPSTSISLDKIDKNLNLGFKTLRKNILLDLTSEIENNLQLLKLNKKELILKKVASYITTPRGSLISFIKDNEIFSGKVIGLSNNGGLKVRLKNKKNLTLICNEVSLKS